MENCSLKFTEMSPYVPGKPRPKINYACKETTDVECHSCGEHVCKLHAEFVDPRAYRFRSQTTDAKVPLCPVCFVVRDADAILKYVNQLDSAPRGTDEISHIGYTLETIADFATHYQEYLAKIRTAMIAAHTSEATNPNELAAV